MLKYLSKIKQIIQKNRINKITFWTVTLIISVNTRVIDLQHLQMVKKTP